MDSFATKIRALESDDRAILMQKYNLLIENWDDPTEKTKILFDVQEYIDSSALSPEQKTDLGSVLNALLVGEERANDDITIAIQVIKNLIPANHPEFTSITAKLDDIASHPTNLVENKRLGIEILQLIEDDSTIEDKYKLTIKDQLKIIVSGGQQSVEPSTEEETTNNGGSMIMGFVGGFVKIFLIIIGVLLLLIGG
jgi:antitoxin component HigA of HigAB toxin-antitoxin module